MLASGDAMNMKDLIIPVLTVAALVSCEQVPRTPKPMTAEIEPRTDGSEAVVVFGGDTMLDDLGLPFLMKYGYSYPFAETSQVFKEADIAVVNLEAPAVRDCNRVAKRYSYYAWPESLVAMKEAGINVLDLANNHGFDCRTKGLGNTIKNIENAGLFHVGAGSGELAHQGLVIAVKGVKVGILAYWKQKKERPGLTIAKPSRKALSTDVKRMKKYYCDVLFVVFHWGKNYHFDVYASQKRYAQIAIDAGADAVVGHHPHIPQPVGTYKGRPIVYSVGNLAFGTGNNRAVNGLLARFRVSRAKIVRTEIIPLLVQNRNPKVLWQTRVLKDERGEKFIEKLNSASKRYGASVHWEDGVGVLFRLR